MENSRALRKVGIISSRALAAFVVLLLVRQRQALTEFV